MWYAFFLFWPANVIPIWVFTSLLQFFIPLNLLFRWCCLGLKHYLVHIIACVVITVAAAINLADLAFHDQNLGYTLLFLFSSLCDVISHALKESIVRN